VNSEELELSLRTEFESYLKGVLAEMRQEATEFQARIEAEFDKHKAQFDEAFRSYAERFDSTREFDEAFTGSVAEHLRLARDEGARITATAIAEAEKLEETGPERAAPSFDLLRDAVNDISTKTSQSAILKTLVDHAAEFAPRGAFFIVKSGHFVGWKVFGDATAEAEDAIREIHFATSSDSILSEALQSLTAVESSAGAHSADAAILVPLHFGEPDRMYALPLMARGRSVAVLYADHGDEGGAVNREALETLVRVAGLTVELLASSQAAQADLRSAAARADFEETQHDGYDETPAAEEVRSEHYFDETPASVETQFSNDAQYDVDNYEMPSESPAEETATPFDSENAGFAFSESVPFDTDVREEQPADAGSVQQEEFVLPEPAAEYSVGDDYPFEQYDSQPFEAEAPETVDEGIEEVPAFEPADEKMDEVHAFEPAEEPAPASTSFSPFEQPVEGYEPAGLSGGYNKVVEQVVDTPVAAVPPSRLRDRPVDLPIEVPEDERRLHNDARRFARLLVSEIKLYNEKKVVEGREAQDLYERLREAIDRSREMYEKRVQPPVAAKFDYFHYEIVNSLADGEVQRLGSNYPGSNV
jgi:hypothetical protein